MTLLALCAVVPYLVPSIIAAYRDLDEKSQIFWLNLLLGWTVLGWVGALIWACTAPHGAYRVEADGDRIGPGGKLMLQGGDPRPAPASAPSAETRHSRAVRTN